MSSSIKRFIGKVKSKRWSESAPSQNRSEEETAPPQNLLDPTEWVSVVDDGQHLHKVITDAPIGGFVVFRGNWKGPIKASKLVSRVPLIKDLIDKSGWGRFFSIDTEKSSARLVEALVERWWDTTHTFHLPGCEIGFTPLDWAMLTGLCIGIGDVPPCDDDAYTFDVVQSRFFAEIKPEDWKSQGIRCSFLKKYFQSEWIEQAMEHPEVATKVARAFFLYFVGEFLMPNASSVVRCGFLAAFEDLNLVCTHDWSTPALALLYMSLDSCSRLKLKSFNGPWQVLEYWAYEYTSICVPMCDRNIDFDTQFQKADIRPKISRWNRINLDPSRTDLVRYNISIARSQLEMRSSASIIWQPYHRSSYEREYDIQCAIFLSRHRLILQYGSQGVWYLGDRCYRQITGEVAIPQIPPTTMSRMKPHEFSSPIDASTLVSIVPQNVYDQYWAKVSIGPIMPNLSHGANIDFIGAASCSDPSTQLPCRARVEGHNRLMRDYFCENSVFPDTIFRRRFRMRRVLFNRILEACVGYDQYFQQRVDATNAIGLSSYQKVTAAMRCLAYGSSADAIDEYVRIGETTVLNTVRKFCIAIVNIFGPQYTRKPNAVDVNRLLDENKSRGFPGMLGSVDCMHWVWKNCPAAWHGQYTGHVHEPTIILEAVASYDLWFWHSFFGMPGSNNDLNVLNRSTLFNDILNGCAPPANYIINNHHYTMGYYLADGIYPPLATIVKTYTAPDTQKKKKFAQMQEGARKDVERAFGVLQARFAIVKGPARMWDAESLSYIMKTCIILHNMIVEDEREEDVHDYDYEQSSSTTAVTPTTTHPSEQTARMARNVVLHDRQQHHMLRQDLVDHIWNEFGEAD